MNDRLKFRVWDKLNKKMFYLSPLEFAFFPYLTQKDKLLFHAYPKRRKSFRAEDATQMIALQCTGIKDKNGKLIFEGDIVKNLREENCFGRGNYEEIIEITIPEYSELSHKGTGGPDGDQHLIETEIIGNIYENPNLLKR